MKSETAEQLKIVLASTFTLYLKTHFCHWSVLGPDFYEYHKLFEEQYTELYESIDVIAEKIRTLGVMAPGSYERYLELSIIESQLPVEPPLSFVGVLLQDHMKMRDMLKEAYKISESEDNYDVSNFLASRMEAHAKHAWMLRATAKLV